MNERKHAVMGFIYDQFEADAITLEDMPLFPEGVRVIDANGGEMIVFWDILHNRVDYRFPDKKGVCS